MASLGEKLKITNKPLDELSYEEAFKELEAIVTALESDEHPLEEAVSLFERGQALADHCADLLDNAELKVQQLTGEELVNFNLD